MNTIDAWAKRWNIPVEAVQELKAVFNVSPEVDPTGSVGVSELAVQNNVRLEACRQGKRLWRNNCGAMYDETRRLVRYGLANESKRVSDRFKSADLIGITPYKITLADVGRLLGVFTAYEVKRYGWKYTGTPREIAQLAFLKFVAAYGGIARFVTSARDVGGCSPGQVPIV